MADDVDQTQTQPAPKSTLRTYAKDVAALGGNISDVSSLPPPTEETPVATPAETTTSETAPPAPEISEPDLPPAYIIPKAPTTNETRESVLARLRAKVAGTPAKSTVPAPSSTDASREAVLARLKSKAETPAPVTPTATPSPIHTYKSDFSDRTKSTGASRISVLAREQDAGTPAPQVVPLHRSRHIVAIGIALIALGAGSIVIAYRLVTGTPVLPPTLSVPSLILPNGREEIVGQGVQLQQALVALEEKNTGEGEAIVAYVTYASTTPNGSTINIPATGGDLIATLGLPAPEIVLRNVSSLSTVGVVNTAGESRPFFILRVDSFERTFAGMLSWEATMENDLAFFYPPYPEPVIREDTATSTPQATTTPVARYLSRFTDEVIRNRDTRVLRDASGKALMLYGYYDKETLIIVRNEAAFGELVTRLQSVRAR